MLSKLLSLASLLAGVLACPGHDNYHQHAALDKRQDPSDGNWTIRVPGTTDWAYEASFNWGRLNPDYVLCQTGTQQSPIGLTTADGFSQTHTPKFTGYDGKWAGNLFNWGYGPGFTLLREDGEYTHLPSFTYDNETVYMIGWHIHAPADHSVDGDRTKAELHFVHVDAEGHEKAVLAFLVDPAKGRNSYSRNSSFVDQLPATLPHFNQTDRQMQMEFAPGMAVDEVNRFASFWTYQGSLTSPPCHEGIRWFVARDVLRTSVPQMQEILRVSTYSARMEQEVWEHDVNV